MSRPSYRFAVCLSIAIHLVCISVAEGAVFLGKVFAPATRYPFVTIQVVHHRPQTLIDQGRSVRRNGFVSHPEAAGPKDLGTEILRFAQDDERRTQDGKTYGTHATKQLHPLLQTFRRFQDFQAKIDQRIQKVRRDLKAALSQTAPAIPFESVTSQVFDLEKVPIRIREHALPIYLKRMRFKIAKIWLRLVPALPYESGVATVQYRIASDGTISAVTVLSDSGEDLFRRSCLTALSKASPLDPLPFHFEQSVEEKYLTVSLTFHLRKAKKI